MPRLPPSLFHRARRISPHLATLLPICRTIESAQNELRWIREHVASTSPQTVTFHSDKIAARRQNATEHRLETLVRRRGAGEPLQYILGSQPFGNLDIECRKGVLIPRSETEDWVLRLVGCIANSLLQNHPRCSPVEDGSPEKVSLAKDVRILDLCSGTGCIGLLLYSQLLHRLTRLHRLGKGPSLRPRVWGFDIEDRAVRLGRTNLVRNLRPGALIPISEYMAKSEDAQIDPRRDIQFSKADIFEDSWMDSLYTGDASGVAREDIGIDILVSNPPYISQRGFNTDTERSVRTHEPRLALVPPPLSHSHPSSSNAATDSYKDLLQPGNPEDVFYARLLQIAAKLRPRVVAFEVGDLGQAMRVMEMALGGRGKQMGLEWDVAEIWCDEMDGRQRMENLHGRNIPVIGSGNGRVVFLTRGG
ncbi:hypothetical protein GGR57DRAFT_305445 [Xylariaceae sp. FL1272]|nr:hypothetical protein GGR57DRAFT_305445 [Xylariaceae sp. FL1272]